MKKMGTQFDEIPNHHGIAKYSKLPVPSFDQRYSHFYCFNKIGA